MLQLTVKVIGEKSDIQSVLELLRTKYDFVRVSMLMQNTGNEGFHLFADLIPKASEVNSPIVRVGSGRGRRW